MYTPTQDDYDALFSKVLAVKIKLEICNLDGTVIAVVEGLKSGGTYNIDGTSSTRRSFNGTLMPTYLQNIFINQNGIVWLDKEVHISIGIKTILKDEWLWYPCGKYLFNSVNTTVNSETKEISFNVLDWWSKLDGTIYGTLGNFEEGSIPAYQENEDGTKIEGTEVSLREALIKILELTTITDYDIEEIGEYSGSTKAEDYENYRINNPNWNKLPYDIEFDSSSTIADLLNLVVGLYPNIDIGFDEDGILHVGYLKSNDNEDIKLTNEQVQRIITSDGEQISYDLTTIKNVVMCVGEVYDTDYYSETVTANDTNWQIVSDSYEREDEDTEGNGYYTGDIISFIAPADSVAGQTINIKGKSETFSQIPLYSSYTSEPIQAEELLKDTTYSIKIKKILSGTEVLTRAYVLGSYQPNALSVCTDDINIYPYTDSKGNEYDDYESLRKYFQDSYNIQNVRFTVMEDSPFTIQKLGERVHKYEEENVEIQSDAEAIYAADYDLWKKVQLAETVTIVTKLIPWLRYNDMIEFQPNGYNETRKYVVKSVSNNLDSYTSTITMYRYYTLYNE